MTLMETEVVKGSEKVCFGDAFVYHFPWTTPGYDSSHYEVWLFSASFMLTFLRFEYEC